MIRNVRPLSLLNDNEVAKAALVIKNILIASIPIEHEI